jgi:DNA helicase-2/ATP-dependent DNA helicase PcrA
MLINQEILQSQSLLNKTAHETLSPWLSNLNPSQLIAAQHGSGPMVVFAGAGSGKTRVITARIANLIHAGVAPWNIVAVTFTNKAAAEMRERAVRMCAESHSSLISTFHSICARWLREFGSQLGFSSDFVIYDDQDSTSAIKAVLRSLVTEEEAGKLAPEMKNFIHEVKTAGYFPGDLERMSSQLAYEIPDGGIRIYKAYQEYLARCNAMDFNDLLLNMLLLLRGDKRVKDIIQTRYKYVLVDEYQDTNRAQFELVGHVVEKSRNLFVVGDDDQSIYSWRGANPANIIDFQKHYPDASKIILEENYRSTKNIVDAANAMIASNRYRVVKTAKTSNPDGDKIDLHFDSDGEMEAWWIADQIALEKMRYPYKSVAIFYRTNAQSRVIEDSLRQKNIPYQIFGAVRFYDRVEVKDIMAYIRIVANEADDVSFRRIVNTPTRGFGDKALSQLETMATDKGLTLLAMAKLLVAGKDAKLGKKLTSFVTAFTKIKDFVQNCVLGDVVQYISSSIEYPEYLKKKYPDQFRDKIENVHELAAALAQYGERHPEQNLAEWLQSVSLVRDEGDEVTEGVSMMTLHMAKGLEFSRVYIAGVEDGILPHKNSVDDNMLIEEERRLFYVGMTRAKEKLTLAYAMRRRNYNQTVENLPSRFLNEIPTRFLSEQSVTAPAGADFDASHSGYHYEYEGEASKSGTIFYEGDVVQHAAYGKGNVEEIDSKLGPTKVTVDFWDFGRRKVSPNQLKLVKR